MQEPSGGGDLDPVAVPDPFDSIEPIEVAVEELAVDGIKATVDDHVIRLVNPVMGSPHLAVLQALGAASDAGHVGAIGAAAYGPAGVAAALWNAPDLHIVRWTGKNRWVAAYKFPARTRPDEYLREESGIPSRLSKGNWYGEVPAELNEAFFAVGLLLDEPPFDVPAVPTRAKPVASVPTRRRTTTPRASAAKPASAKSASSTSSPKTPRPKAAASRVAKPVDTTRSCPGCNLKKHPSQFIADSDLCVDCR